MPAKRDPTVRFFEKIERIPEAGCWLWTDALNKDGYGLLMVHGKVVTAHRFSWRIHFGDAGESHVLHWCDVRCCVNPFHLFDGSHADNMADMKAKNRARGHPGERNTKAKFSREQVDAIRELLSKGYSCNSIAKSLGVVHSTISRIKRGEGWK